MPQLAGRRDHVFRQPSSRDTGMALYVALAMIKRWTPNAIVTITPTDHYVAPDDKYVEQVRARGVAARSAIASSCSACCRPSPTPSSAT